jgi:hypothetical protein
MKTRNKMQSFSHMASLPHATSADLGDALADHELIRIVCSWVISLSENDKNILLTWFAKFSPATVSPYQYRPVRNPYRLKVLRTQLRQTLARISR